MTPDTASGDIRRGSKIEDHNNVQHDIDKMTKRKKKMKQRSGPEIAMTHEN